MPALAFVTAAKNAYLESLLKGTSPATYQLTGLRALSGGGTHLFVASNTYVNLTWNSPVQGVATCATASAPSPVAAGTIATIEYWATAYATQVATGTASLTGGGGNIIVTNMTTQVGVAHPFSITFKVPLNNGGTLRFNQALANAWCNSILLNTSHPNMATSGTISFYDGTQPATADTAITTQALKGQLTLAAADYSTAAGGSQALAASKTVTPSADGTPTWFRWVKGAYIMDGSVGTVGTDAIFNVGTWTNGVNVSLTGLTLTVP